MDTEEQPVDSDVTDKIFCYKMKRSGNLQNKLHVFKLSKAQTRVSATKTVLIRKYFYEMSSYTYET